MRRPLLAILSLTFAAACGSGPAVQSPVSSPEPEVAHAPPAPEEEAPEPASSIAAEPEDASPARAEDDGDIRKESGPAAGPEPGPAVFFREGEGGRALTANQQGRTMLRAVSERSF